MGEFYVFVKKIYEHIYLKVEHLWKILGKHGESVEKNKWDTECCLVDKHIDY